MRRTTSASSLSTSGAVAPPTATAMPSSSTVQSIHSTGNGSVKSNKSATLAYLTSYESMVRSQDDECDKTHAFLGEAVKRLQLLGGPAKKNSRDVVNAASNATDNATNTDATSNDDVSQQGGMLTYREMRRALLRLGYTWNRSSSITSSSSRYYDDDDIVSLASQTSKSSRVSGTSGRVLGGKQRKRKDVVATDNQLIMLLSILVEMEEHWRCTEMSSDNNDDDKKMMACMNITRTRNYQNVYANEPRSYYVLSVPITNYHSIHLRYIRLPKVNRVNHAMD
eukprot:scaffold20861_cov46-Cyclotella_meneghiniana.AAC.3